VYVFKLKQKRQLS